MGKSDKVVKHGKSGQNVIKVVKHLALVQLREQRFFRGIQGGVQTYPSILVVQISLIEKVMSDSCSA